MEILLLLGRLLSSVSANVVQKKLTQQALHPLTITFAAYSVLFFIALPLLPWIDFTALSQHFWLNITFAALLDMAATVFLVMSLSRTDLSVFGPLNAYKVVCSMLLAMVFLGEIPSIQGFIGVAIIVIGSVLLFPPKITQQNRLVTLFSDRGVQYRFLSILLFSIGTLPLKNAVVSSGPLATTVFWCLIGLPLAGGLFWIFQHRCYQTEWQRSQQQKLPLLILGIMIFIMQFTTLWLFSTLLIAYSLALFQLSMVLQVFLGYRFFNEKQLVRRLAACGVMITGCIVVLTT